MRLEFADFVSNPMEPPASIFPGEVRGDRHGYTRKMAAPPSGTNLRDTLHTITDGNVLYGLGGRDLLRSTFDRTSLFGDAGNDTLITTLSFGEDAGKRSALVQQSGDDGCDSLKTSISLWSGDGAKSEVFQNGGRGNDRIVASNAPGSFGTAQAINTADGGLGNDFIDLRAVREASGLG